MVLLQTLGILFFFIKAFISITIPLFAGRMTVRWGVLRFALSLEANIY